MWFTALALAAPSSTPPAPTHAPVGLQRWDVGACRDTDLRSRLHSSRIHPARAERDVDGDGEPDALLSDYGMGSGEGGSALTLTLSTTGETIEISTLCSFSSMVSANAIPRSLIGPGRSAARAFVEDADIGMVCPAPHPSFALLLEPDRSPVWQPGPLVMPPMHSVVRDGTWLTYLGHTHGGLGQEAGTYPRELDARDGLRLLRTAHGVAVEAVEPVRHAWLWVSPGGSKLRWPIPIEGRFTGSNAVEIRYRRDVLDLDAAWTTKTLALPR